jgi:hypothetical protein
MSLPSASIQSACVSLRTTCSGVCRFLVAIVIVLPAHNMGGKTLTRVGPTNRGHATTNAVATVRGADDPDFDLRRVLPALPTPIRTPDRTSTWGLVLGSDPELGTDVTIHPCVSIAVIGNSHDPKQPPR